MYDVFISYKSEQVDQARRLFDALESSGWSVWWDQRLLGGEGIYDEIGKALETAKCVIVLWSTLSTGSLDVKKEARYALKHKKLVQVALDDTKLPFEFDDVRTIDLQGWNGSRNSSAFLELVKRITKICQDAVAATTDKEARADMLDFRNPPKPEGSAGLKCVSAGTEVEAMELMHLHHDLIQDDWERSRFDSGVRSVFPGVREAFASPIDGPITRTYGRITRQELVRVPKVSGWKHVASGSRDEKKRAVQRSSVAQSALDRMPSSVEAIDYMPRQLRSLPDHLRGPAVRILVFSMAGFGNRPFEITEEALRRGCSLVSDEEVSEIARHLGWKLS